MDTLKEETFGVSRFLAKSAKVYSREIFHKTSSAKVYRESFFLYMVATFLENLQQWCFFEKLRENLKTQGTFLNYESTQGKLREFFYPLVYIFI